MLEPTSRWPEDMEEVPKCPNCFVPQLATYGFIVMQQGKIIALQGELDEKHRALHASLAAVIRAYGIGGEVKISESMIREAEGCIVEVERQGNKVVYRVTNGD